MAWYNRYRPTRFEDVVGQDLVKQIMQKTVTQDTPKHAYLLSGPRGVGKTTLARIFAYELNAVHNNSQAALDIIELDAASNTGIDDIRMLKESAQVAPIAGKYKVFIIDEVHMLSKPAMNALLKTLEEPPHYLIFLLATTNPEKIIPTVLSRLIKLPLASHTQKGLVQRLQYIAEQEKVTIEKEALEMIAKRANGSQRDAINSLETIASFGFEVLTADVVGELLGLVPETVFEDIANALSTLSDKTLRAVIEELNRLNIDPYPFLDQALNYFLEQSLLQNKPVDPLIKAFATVLDLNFPITTNFQAVSLVATYFHNSPVVMTRSESKPEYQEKKTTQVSDDDTEIAQTNIAEEDISISVQESHSTQSEVKPEESESTSILSEELVEKLRSSTQPTALKLIPDLNISQREGKVVLSTAVGMFVPTLKSDSVKNWVHEYIPGVEIIVEQNTTLLPNKQKKQSSKKVEKTASNTAPAIQKSRHSDEVFYKVYNKLPEGITQNLKLFEGKIPRPTPKNGEKSFDEHADELFEFE